MRLRETIRPPGRLSEEASTYTTPRRTYRRGSISSRVRCEAFNPNLPPAAFPTLDRPRDPKPNTDAQNNNADDYTSRKRSYNCMDTGSHGHPQPELVTETWAEVQEIPVELIDNLFASNGELNSVYRKNMAIMAGAGPERSPFEESMEDSDTDEEAEGLAIEPLAPIDWHDLLPPVQVEIFENVESSYSRPARALLGISDEDLEEVQHNLVLRARQLKREDRLLEAMRAKQLRAILQTNNAAPRASQVPPKLACQMISRRYLRNIRGTTTSDFLTCPADEVLRARRYIEKREMDGSIVGDWGDDDAVRMQLSVEDLTRKSEKNPASHLYPSEQSVLSPVGDSAFVDISSPRTDRTSAQVSLINSIGTKCLPMLKDSVLCQGQANDPPRWLALSHWNTSENYHHPNWDNHVKTREIEEILEAQRTNPDGQYIQLRNTFLHFPPLSWIFHERSCPVFASQREAPGEASRSNQGQRAHSNTSTRTSQMAARRTKSSGSSPSSETRLVRVFMRLRQEITVMVIEARRRMTERSNREVQRAALSDHRKLPYEDIWTPPTSPSRGFHMPASRPLRSVSSNVFFTPRAAVPQEEDARVESSDSVMSDLSTQDTEASARTSVEPRSGSEAKEQSETAMPEAETSSEVGSTGSGAEEYDTADEMVLVPN
ncbi:uncharacterized protein BO97DRAFT_429559 [Aspergillus homomorphus CBS 101889]|uniref:Uncharacterized protein n=1 Tax=Aspergillus homomorphus (strain CBS 101889) TaxID=1450537 RepID=A0A395HLN4_ASPHC|nr:hypothetical protein BO97DRAFT_429559 [Aspergillus homomorphus CBS 101889]RAL07184.1 hypothetical protein BO97DRAFT_429559 [Aspergillus homomorphus CBS 101889]